ncbi:MAG: hypothetical protein IJ637_06190 [Prevotella sp.]|nr:hypothetical protein [Prevotella sp.]
MKKLFTLLFTVLLVLPGGAKDPEYYYSTISYEDKTIRLTTCFYGTEYSPLRVFGLPAQINGYNLTEIGYTALMGYSYRVNIPEGVTSMEEQMLLSPFCIYSFPSTLTNYTGSSGYADIIILNGQPLDMKKWASRQVLYIVAPGTRDGWVAAFATADPMWGKDWNIIEQGAMPSGANYSDFLNKAWSSDLPTKLATADEQVATLPAKYEAYNAVYTPVKALYDEVKALHQELDDWTYEGHVVTDEQKSAFSDRLFDIYLTIPYVSDLYGDNYNFVQTYWPERRARYVELRDAEWPATTDDFAERYLDMKIDGKAFESIVSTISDLSENMTAESLESKRESLNQRKIELLALKADMEALPLKPTLTLHFDKAFEVYGRSYLISTYSASFQTELPDGFVAWAVTGVVGGVVQTEYVGTRIPANIGVLIIAQDKEPGDYTAKTADELGYYYEEQPQNLLVAHVEAGTIDVIGRKLYGFFNNNGNPEFRRLTAGGTAPANKAYLDLTDYANAPSMLSLEFGNTTAIDLLQSAQYGRFGSIFNLNGQRVMNPSKGLFIVNGKKVVLK